RCASPISSVSRSLHPSYRLSKASPTSTPSTRWRSSVFRRRAGSLRSIGRSSSTTVSPLRQALLDSGGTRDRPLGLERPRHVRPLSSEQRVGVLATNRFGVRREPMRGCPPVLREMGADLPGEYLHPPDRARRRIVAPL